MQRVAVFEGHMVARHADCEVRPLSLVDLSLIPQFTTVRDAYTQFLLRVPLSAALLYLSGGITSSGAARMNTKENPLSKNEIIQKNAVFAMSLVNYLFESGVLPDNVAIVLPHTVGAKFLPIEGSSDQAQHPWEETEWLTFWMLVILRVPEHYLDVFLKGSQSVLASLSSKMNGYDLPRDRRVEAYRALEKYAQQFYNEYLRLDTTPTNHTSLVVLPDGMHSLGSVLEQNVAIHAEHPVATVALPDLNLKSDMNAAAVLVAENEVYQLLRQLEIIMPTGDVPALQPLAVERIVPF